MKVGLGCGGGGALVAEEPGALPAALVVQGLDCRILLKFVLGEDKWSISNDDIESNVRFATNDMDGFMSIT